MTMADGGRYTDIDITVPHPARRYNYWLGGKDHFAADRTSGDAVAAVYPAIVTAAQENRRYLRRVVEYLADECGIRQFLDIGTGLPTADNTHEVVQRIDPAARVVYVDNDPLVVTHARALLTGTAEGATGYLEADLRDPQAILDAPEVTDVLDLDKPVGLLLIAVLHFITDDEDPYRLVAALRNRLAPGSYVALSHATWDVLPPETVARLTPLARDGSAPFTPRTRADVAPFLTGLDLIDPGLVLINHWHADGEAPPRPSDEDTATYGAVARVPTHPGAAPRRWCAAGAACEFHGHLDVERVDP
jgi:SAM-dependent methyltransferase